MKKKEKGNDDETTTRTAWKVDEIPRRVEGARRGGKRKLRNGRHGEEQKEEGKKKGGEGEEKKEWKARREAR